MMPADTSVLGVAGSDLCDARQRRFVDVGEVRWQLRREFDAQLAAFVDTLLPAMNDLFAVWLA
jgi:hypothetical protein